MRHLIEYSGRGYHISQSYRFCDVLVPGSCDKDTLLDSILRQLDYYYPIMSMVHGAETLLIWGDNPNAIVELDPRHLDKCVTLDAPLQQSEKQTKTHEQMCMFIKNLLYRLDCGYHLTSLTDAVKGRFVLISPRMYEKTVELQLEESEMASASASARGISGLTRRVSRYILESFTSWRTHSVQCFSVRPLHDGGSRGYTKYL